MTNPSISTDIQEAISLTEEMLRLAKSSEWEDFEETEKKRTQVFQRAFPEDFPAELADFARTSIETIKRMDVEITTLAKACQNLQAKQLRKLQKSSKAAKSYQEHN